MTPISTSRIRRLRPGVSSSACAGFAALGLIAFCSNALADDRPPLAPDTVAPFSTDSRISATVEFELRDLASDIQADIPISQEGNRSEDSQSDGDRSHRIVGLHDDRCQDVISENLAGRGKTGYFALDCGNGALLPLAELPHASTADLDQALEAAKKGFTLWRAR